MSIDFKCEIDPEMVNRKLSLREKIAIRLLLMIFGIVYPAKYEHQVKSAFQPLLQLLNE